MKNLLNSHEVPIGLGMALAMNIEAMKHFTSLSLDAQRQVIEHTHSIQSKEEMKAYVQTMVDGTGAQTFS